jgi:hypothetical protein
MLADEEFAQRDYLIIRTARGFETHATFETVDLERIGELRRATLGTRRQPDGIAVAIPIRTVSMTGDGKHVVFNLPRGYDPEGYFLSGSVLVGAYGDGTTVLVGIVSAMSVETVDVGAAGISGDDLILGVGAGLIPIHAFVGRGSEVD